MTYPGTRNEQTDRIETPQICRTRRCWWRVLLYLFIFTAGGVVGIGVTLIVIRDSALFAVHHPEEMPARIAARMASVLSLSEEQRQQVEDILHQRQGALQNIRREFQPQVEAELDRLEQQVSAVLNDEQRENWQARFDYLRRTWVPEPPPGE